jgi:hypothetical protein
LRVQNHRRLDRTVNNNKYYLRLGLVNDEGVRKFVLVHRLVAITFIPTVDPNMQINHKNGITVDNRAKNLEWVTPHENQIHCYNVLYPDAHKGEKHNGTNLTNDKVKEIFNLTRKGNLTLKEIANKYETSKSVVSSIKRGITWSSVTGK